MPTCPPLRISLAASKALGSSQVLYVDSGIANLLGDSPGTGALPDGSVISTSTSFGGAFVNVYSAIASADGNRRHTTRSRIS